MVTHGLGHCGMETTLTLQEEVRGNLRVSSVVFSKAVRKEAATCDVWCGRINSLQIMVVPILK